MVFFISLTKLLFLIWSAIFLVLYNHQLIVENNKPTSCMQCVCIHFLKGFCWIKAVYLNCLYPKETEFHHVLGIKISGMLFVLQSFVLKSFGLQNICSADHLFCRSFVLQIICPKIIWFTKHLFCRSFVLQFNCPASNFFLQTICPANHLYYKYFVMQFICPTHHLS